MPLGQRLIPCGRSRGYLLSHEPDKCARLDVAGRDSTCGRGHIIGHLLNTNTMRCIALGLDLRVCWAVTRIQCWVERWVHWGRSISNYNYYYH